MRLGLAGYTKNLRDGRVEVYAIGDEKVLAEFLRQLERGPASAAVSGVSASEAAVDEQYEAGFSIEYDR